MCKSCNQCIRILMIIFNVIFVLCGLAILAVSLFFYFTLFNGSGEKNFLIITLFVLMGVGGITVLLGICGCCGAYHVNQCLLGSYFSILLIIFAAEVAGGVVGFIYLKKADELVGKVFKNAVDEINAFNGKHSIGWIDWVQQSFKCCGVNSHTEYQPYPPRSCCHQPVQTLCTSDFLSTASTWINPPPGCKTQLEAAVKEKLLIPCGIIIGIALIELIGLIFSMTLCCSARQGTDYTVVEQHA